MILGRNRKQQEAAIVTSSILCLCAAEPARCVTSLVGDGVLLRSARLSCMAGLRILRVPAFSKQIFNQHVGNMLSAVLVLFLAGGDEYSICTRCSDL